MTRVLYEDGSYVEYHIEGELGENSIPNKTNAVKVKIGKAVTSIGKKAFFMCKKITSVEIPNEVTLIDNSAFMYCQRLSSIKIPSGITSIRQSTFSGCSNLSSISIPDNIIDIQSYAFQECKSLSSIVIPNSVVTIGNTAFANCYELTSAVIGTGLTSIGNEIFSNCSKLISISVDNDNSNYTSKNNLLLSKDEKTVIQGVNGDVTIPDGVENIGRYAFEGCSNLTSIDIPNSVTTISSDAFYRCFGLTSIVIPENVTAIGNNSLQGCSNLQLLVCNPVSAPSVKSQTFGYNQYGVITFTGWNTHSDGTNVLKIPQGATGYDSSYWLDPLQDSTKCGFHIEYLD